MTEPDDATIDQPGRGTPHEHKTVVPTGSAVVLAGILDQYMADLQAGKAADKGQLMAAHPELASQLEGCLAGIEFVHSATCPTAAEPAALGEFRIVREIGRGGMGVVYEAEQTSLRRRVALKVLRFGVVADEAAMERFRREAETVARLHHTNIVPIFAIGCERGVHYYAMQLIDGRSLADVLDESQRAKKPLKTEDVARWSLQAAEALAHAHHRGVIHRDIKPSNLLLDNEGVVWLTDFGLAKRADEVTMTVSGTLMGTPRYMSPEQAESLQHKIDHRTDIYSLGASLYELATGRPLFESATPHGVVMQILTEEPARPRQIRPDLPRDLETIILTCLAKDAAQRYQTAQSLVDDLRAVLSGAPIHARRVPLGERLARYIRKRRKTIVITAMAAAITVLMVVGAFLGYRYYTEWRLGEIVLTTDGPPLRAEVLSESGDEPITKPIDVVTRAVVPLPADEYRLRVNGNGRLGQTYRFGVDRGVTRTYRLPTDENRLLGTESIPYAFATEALVLSPLKADLVEWTGQTLIRRDAATGKPIWDASRSAKPWEEKRDPIAWMRRLSYLGDELRPGSIVQPAPDLDGDGTGDIVWAFRGTPSLLALSGKDGSMLWTYTADVETMGGPDTGGPALPKAIEQIPRPGLALGLPIACDADGDGVLDLISAFDVRDTSGLRGQKFASLRPYMIESLARRIVIAAVSGRSGRVLWCHPLASEIKRDRVDQFQIGLLGCSLLRVRDEPVIAFHGDEQWIGLRLATGKQWGPPIHLTSRDWSAGRGSPVIQPVEYADLDGDGSPEVIALRGVQSPSTLAAISLSSGKTLWEKVVWVLHPEHSGYHETEWPLVANSEWPLLADLDGDGRAEIAIPDVGSIAPGKNNGPISSPAPNARSSAIPPPGTKNYGGVQLIDGATGQTRWTRPLELSEPHSWGTLDGLTHLAIGPDLNGDGIKELVAVSRIDGGTFIDPRTGVAIGGIHGGIYVDALSGKDGAPLWWWHTDFEDHSMRPWRFVIGRPHWWGRGPDGWPMLVVPLGGNTPGATAQAESDRLPDPSVIHLLTASTGRESHILSGLSWPKLADLDGDGLIDLWGSVDGKLKAIRGDTPEAALDPFDPAGDLDCDGTPDVVSRMVHEKQTATNDATPTPMTVARSGSSGRVLWRQPLDPFATHISLPLPGGDLDGDGAPEVVVTNGPRKTPGLPLDVLCGRSGRPFWSAGLLPTDSETPGAWSSGRRIPALDLRVCEPQGKADFLVVHTRLWQSDNPYDVPTEEKVLGKTVVGYRQRRPGGMIDHWQVRLARLSGRDGRVTWDQLLVEREHPRFSMSSEYLPDVTVRQYGDLDGDGGLDAVLNVVLEATRPTNRAELVRTELRAISLRDGKALWSHPIRSQSADAILLCVGDLDADGRAEVVLVDEPAQKGQAPFELAVLDGRDGSTRWTWRGGDNADRSKPQTPLLRLVDFEGKGRRHICLNVGLANGLRRVVILDARGQEHARRDLGPTGSITLESADLDGDGREELLFHDAGRLRASRADLIDLWSWPSGETIRQILPVSAERPATVVINPMVGLDGATGRPRWAGRPALAVLEPTVAPSLPRLLAGSSDSTTVREALPTTPDGAYQEPQGSVVRTRVARDDPRWSRPFPWASDDFRVELAPYLSLGGLALVGVIIPFALIRLAIRKGWGRWLPLALPVFFGLFVAMYRWWPGFVVRVPSGILLALRPWDVHELYHPGSSLGGVFAVDFQHESPRTAFVLSALAGIPIAVYAIAVGSSLVRRRWRRLLCLTGLIIIGSAIVGACWVRWDARTMLAIEYYTWSRWYFVLLPGAYLAGVLAILAGTARGLYRLVRPGRRKAA